MHHPMQEHVCVEEGPSQILDEVCVTLGPGWDKVYLLGGIFPWIILLTLHWVRTRGPEHQSWEGEKFFTRPS